MLHWSITLTGAKTRILQKGQKYLESSKMWCWRRTKISWTNRVRNKEVLHRVKKERNMLQTIKRRKAKWIGHILHRNCLLKQVTEGKIEVTRRWERRGTHLVEYMNAMTGYCKFTAEAPDHTIWITCFGRGYGPVIRQTWNECIAMGFQVFYDVTLCHCLRGFWHFLGSWCCNVKGEEVHGSWTEPSWGWMNYNPSKYQQPLSHWQSVTPKRLATSISHGSTATE